LERKYNGVILVIVALLSLSLCFGPGLAVAKKPIKEINVLYLSNDYYQVSNGSWIFAADYIVNALENSQNTKIKLTFINVTLYIQWEGKIRLGNLSNYDVIILSDVWYSVFTSEQLTEIENFVNLGGGLVMMGGWGSFGGYHGYGEWDGTIIEKILPVEIISNEDAVNNCTFKIKINHCNAWHGNEWHPNPGHPVVRGLAWHKAPYLYGYNKVAAKCGAEILAYNSVTRDPIIVAGRYGCGRTLAFATDPTPGWGADFVNWVNYDDFLVKMVNWLAG
jgi:uncharacterized membrane protein